MTLHEIRDLVQTCVTFSSALAFVWGLAKFASRVNALKDIPQKVDTLTDKVESVDRKVENLSGQFEVFKTFGRGK